MRLETLARSLEPLAPRMRCPLCAAPLALWEGRSLCCENRHTYDLSAKGYVNLAPSHNQKAEKYGAALFESRRRIFADGFYTHVANALCELAAELLARIPADLRWQNPLTGLPIPGMPPPSHFAPLVVDVGCGEGYYAREMQRALPDALVAGVDLSRDAVLAAARESALPRWMVADLTRLPFQDGSVSLLLDVLTPADYREFRRVLRPDGWLIKVVPGDDYLIEIREALGDRLHAGAFSNEKVVRHLFDNAWVSQSVPLSRTLPVTPAQAADFLRMTPMTFGLGPEQLEDVHFSQITVAMDVLVCNFR